MHPRALPDPRASERGFGLIEVIVSTMLMGIVVITVLGGMSAAQRASGAERSGTVAGTVAQRDQERMRSMPVAALLAEPVTRSEMVGGVPYTIQSEAQFVADVPQPQSCTNPNVGEDYLEIRTTVSWPAMGGARPVTLESLRTAPAGDYDNGKGVVLVTVRNRSGAGIPGVTVRLTGTTAFTAATDADGCAVFAPLVPGPYAVVTEKAGYVDKDGAAAPEESITVTGGETTMVEGTMDVAASLNVDFDTVDWRGRVATASAKLMVAHDEMSAPFTRQFPQAGAPAAYAPTPAAAPHTRIPAWSLFPFTSAYRVYAGGCARNDPRLYGVTPVAQATVAPGGSPALTVRVPTLNFFTYEGRRGIPARLVIRDECGEVTVRQLGADGLLAEAFPYGIYTVCAEEGNRKLEETVRSDSPNGEIVDFAFKRNTPAGVCSTT